MKDISLEKLLEVGAHFGHQTKRWHPKMKPYIYAARDGVHIFDLVKTKEGLEEACRYVEKITGEGGTLVFIGTKRQAQAIIVEEAKKAGFPCVSNRWLGGTISNWSQIKKSLDKLAEMTQKREAGEFKAYTKKEQSQFDQEIVRLDRRIGGLTGLKQPPEAIFVVDVKKDLAAVREARTKGVGVVAIVDTNVDPGLVDYVIPANDDAVSAIKLIVGAVAAAAKAGREAWEKKNEKAQS
ncbi:MAG: 30S ribosomal protein S2 [Candidatus Shapirobacteria bacterium]